MKIKSEKSLHFLRGVFLAGSRIKQYVKKRCNKVKNPMKYSLEP